MEINSYKLGCRDKAFLVLRANIVFLLDSNCFRIMTFRVEYFCLICFKIEYRSFAGHRSMIWFRDITLQLVSSTLFCCRTLEVVGGRHVMHSGVLDWCHCPTLRYFTSKLV